MSLTVLTAGGSAHNSGAFGQPYSQTVRFQSSEVSIIGETIQVRVAPFANPADALPAAAEQTVCYTATMPAGMITVNMMPTTSLHFTKHLYKVTLSYVSPNTFDIEVRMLLKMDEGEIWTNTTQDNLNRLEKNIVTNPVPDNNDLLSVYSGQRELRIEATHFDGTTAENAVFQKAFSARFYCDASDCCEEFDCLNPAIGDIGYQLFRNGGVVTNFSAYDNTTLYFTATLNAGAISKYYIALYRRDNQTNAAAYWQDLSMNYAEVDTATIGGLSGAPFDTSAFVSATDFTQIGVSDIYEASIELDASYFTLGGEYRAFIVIETLKGEGYSCNTDAIKADECPDGVTGTVTSATAFHDKLSTVYTEDRFINVATRQRIIIEVEHDKVSYNAALNALLLAGDFNSNLIGTGVAALDHMPALKEILSTNLPLFQYEPDVDTSGLRTIFRIPETWDDSARYIVFWWKFKITSETGSCIYEVRKIISLTLTDNDEDITNHFVPTVKDDDGNVFEDRICADLEGNINVCFDEVLSEEFTFIPIIRQATSGDFYNEEDAFTNTELVTLHADEIISTEDETAGDGQACYIIDPTELTLGADYQTGGIFIPQTPSAPPSPCVNLDLLVNSEVTDITLPHWILSVDFTLVGLTDEEVISFQIDYEGGGQNGTKTVTTATLVYPIIKPVHQGNTLTMNYTAFIILKNGCAYELDFTMQNFAVDGDIDTQNFVLTPF